MTHLRQQKVLYLHICECTNYKSVTCHINTEYLSGRSWKTPAKSNLTVPSSFFIFVWAGEGRRWGCLACLTSQEHHVPAEFSFQDAKTLKVLFHFPHMHREALSDLGPAQPADVRQWGLRPLKRTHWQLQFAMSFQKGPQVEMCTSHRPEAPLINSLLGKKKLAACAENIKKASDSPALPIYTAHMFTGWRHKWIISWASYSTGRANAHNVKGARLCHVGRNTGDATAWL